MTTSPAIGGQTGPAIGGQTGVGGDLATAQTAANLKKAGQQFEAMFDGMMLKAMRQAKLADPLFDSKSIDTFTEMQDAAVATSMAEHQPIGIGKAMTDFLSRSPSAQADLNRAGGSASP